MPAPAPDPDSGRAAAAAAFVGIARRIQATVNQELHDLRAMQERHGDTPEVFGDLLRLDHGVSLIGRLADSLAVLGGADPGRRRTRPVDLLDVVRGAMSRIVEYPRVDVEVPADTAVAAAAVEPVVHALAELLDNATRYSPPDTRVRVCAEYASAPGGDGVQLVVAVEDAGVGLNPATQRYATGALSGAEAEADPVRPEGPPRLGLTVIGRLARSTGFQAEVGAGAEGGTRAVLRLPAALVTVPERSGLGGRPGHGVPGGADAAGRSGPAGPGAPGRGPAPAGSARPSPGRPPGTPTRSARAGCRNGGGPPPPHRTRSRWPPRP
ncbi:ATP-binding protein [Catenulispora yoronensis]